MENLNENVKEKKNGKGLIVLVVVLSLLLCAVCGYICYDKFLEDKEEIGYVNNSNSDENVNLEEKEGLVEGNNFSLASISCTEASADKCTKNLKVSYNNANHDIRIEFNSNDEYKLYVDNTLVDTLKAGLFEDSNVNFNGMIYIIDSKFLAFAREQFTPSGSGYVLTIYNENGRVGDEVEVSPVGLTIYINNDKSVDVTDLDNLKFDGKSFQFYLKSCSDKIVKKYSLTTDGNKINMAELERFENAIVGGSEYCYSEK